MMVVNMGMSGMGIGMNGFMGMLMGMLVGN